VKAARHCIGQYEGYARRSAAEMSVRRAPRERIAPEIGGRRKQLAGIAEGR